MKRFLLIVLFPVLAFGLDFFTMQPNRTDDVAYSDTTGVYSIHFDINSSIVMYPAVMGTGGSISHYSATITVSRAVSNTWVKIATFDGQYTGGKCFEDRPEYLVARALESEKGAKRNVVPWAEPKTNILIVNELYTNALVPLSVESDASFYKRKAADGTICSALGHVWKNTPDLFLINRPYQLESRTCALCGKVETRKMEEWK